ncbi:hypothetical protein LR48_Vigan02g021600 [Vigna angularis]|uniref:Uncharacterized protein n=1 Tax=Phaseolus angularis TaxID=3914 RepID=A0A0L9TU93_PHAAN|nr:hypothetical protein LR48_Vigan02g021600 [Vigna angularis]
MGREEVAMEEGGGWLRRARLQQWTFMWLSRAWSLRFFKGKNFYCFYHYTAAAGGDTIYQYRRRHRLPSSSIAATTRVQVSTNDHTVLIISVRLPSCRQQRLHQSSYALSMPFKVVDLLYFLSCVVARLISS